MPLISHNRVLVALGLERLRNNPRPGIEALCRVAGVDPATLDTRAVSLPCRPGSTPPVAWATLGSPWIC